MTKLEAEIPGYINGKHIVRRGSEVLANIFTRKSFSEGSREHLAEAVVLWQAGVDAWIASKHESDADVPLVDVAIRNGGFSEFSDSMFILMGNKILDKRFRGLVARNYPHVAVPQPGSDNGKMRELLPNAKTAIPKLLEERKVAFVFPEGTRSRDGVLQNALPSLAHYLTDHAFVLPMAIEGARQAWPVEGLPRLFQEITFHFAQPILIRDVMTEIDYYEKTTGVKASKSIRNEIIVDTIMRRGIAPLVPIEQRGPYTNPNVSIPDMLQKNAKRENLVI